MYKIKLANKNVNCIYVQHSLSHGNLHINGDPLFNKTKTRLLELNICSFKIIWYMNHNKFVLNLKLVDGKRASSFLFFYFHTFMYIYTNKECFEHPLSTFWVLLTCMLKDWGTHEINLMECETVKYGMEWGILCCKHNIII